MCTYKRLNFPLITSIYLVVLPLEMQKRPKQTKVCHAFSYFVLKDTIHKSSKMATAKKLFSSVYIFRTTCFDGWFFLSDNWKTLIFMKVYRSSDIVLSAMFLLSLKPVF